MTRFALPAAIVALALVDGLIHLSLDIFFFHGRFFGDILTILFLLNFTGYVVLVGGFLLSTRRSLALRRLVDVALLGYAMATVLAWLGSGDSDLLGLGLPAKAVEVTLIVALIAHLWTLKGAHQLPRVLALQRSRRPSRYHPRLARWGR